MHPYDQIAIPLLGVGFVCLFWAVMGTSNLRNNTIRNVLFIIAVMTGLPAILMLSFRPDFDTTVPELEALAGITPGIIEVAEEAPETTAEASRSVFHVECIRLRRIHINNSPARSRI